MGAIDEVFVEPVACYDTKNKAVIFAIIAILTALAGVASGKSDFIVAACFLILIVPLLLFWHGKLSVYIEGENLYSKGIVGITKRINLSVNNKAVFKDGRLAFITPSGKHWTFDNLWLSNDAFEDIAAAVARKGVKLIEE